MRTAQILVFPGAAAARAAHDACFKLPHRRYFEQAPADTMKLLTGLMALGVILARAILAAGDNVHGEKQLRNVNVWFVVVYNHNVFLFQNASPVMRNPEIDFEQMIKQAENTVEALSIDQVLERRNRENVLLVDIRDIRELDRDGRIPGARHIPQGMLEFWMHPQSPYYKDYFNDIEEVILFCNRGWRSARASKGLNELGFGVMHMVGGFGDWVERGLEIDKSRSR